MEGGPGEGSERILKIMIFENLIFFIEICGPDSMYPGGGDKKDPGRGGKVVK